MSWMRRLQAEDGVTLVELLIAMVVMAIGISAIVAGYSSGILAVDRAKADVDRRRARRPADGALPPGLVRGSAPTGLRQRHDDDSTTDDVLDADRRSLDLRVRRRRRCPIGWRRRPARPASRPVKLVTITVRDGPPPEGRVLFSESSTFDSSTG